MNVVARNVPATGHAMGNPVSGWSTGRIAITLYVIAGGLTIAAYQVLGDRMSDVAFVLASALGFAALVIGPLVHRPASALPWRWLAAGLAAFTIGNGARLSFRLGGPTELAWLSDLGYVGYLLLAIGLMMFIRVRRPRYRVARLIDGLAVGGVATLVVSVNTIAVALPPDPDPMRLLSITVGLTFDALLLGGTAFLVLAGGGLRERAQQLLLIGAGLTACADVIYNVHVASPGVSNFVLDAMWMASYLLIGLAALTPSMRQLTEPQTEDPERAASRAMIFLAAAVALLTLLDVVEKLASDSGDAWFEVAETFLVVLLLLRARESARHEAARERRVALLLSHAADALAIVGADGAIKLTNPAAARMFGVPEGNATGQPLFEFLERIDPADQDSMRLRLTQVMDTPDATDRARIRLRVDDGTYRSLEVTAANRLTDPAVSGIVLNFRDVTDQVRANSELSRLGTAIEQASDAVVVTDTEARIEYVNPAFEQISGYSREEVVGQNPRFLKSGEQTPIFYDAMWQTLTGGKPWRADFVNRRKDGSIFRMVGVITPLRDETGRLTGYVGVQRDVTKQRALETAAHRIARERALVAQTLRGLDPRETPEKIAQSVCNQLFAINAVTLAALFVYEADGSAAPYGFAVTNGQTAPHRRLPRPRTSQIRERTSVGPFIEAWHDRPGHPYNELIAGLGTRAHAYVPVRDGNAEIGFLVVGSAADDAEDALTNSLAAIVECAEIAGTLMGVKVGERTELSTERKRIDQIIDGRAFFPVFQQLHDVTTDRVIGFEALTRFDDGVSPDIRFAEAHAVGLGERLELATMEAAIDGGAAIPREQWLNINVSPSVLMSGGLQRLINSCERDIVLEVTEHSEITDYHAFRRAVQELGPRVRLAVDDAGAGFASLRHILELRPAFVKLDRQVIAGIDVDEARQAMVAGLHHFALNTGCWLIAEGVETAGELRTLRDLGVRYAQGYLLGRPVPSDQLGASDRAATPAVGGGAEGQLSIPRRRRR